MTGARRRPGGGYGYREFAASTIVAIPIRSATNAAQPQGTSRIPSRSKVGTPCRLTVESPRAALRLLRRAIYFFGVVMDNIVDSVLSSFGREVSGPAKEKLLGYIQLLASTGQSHDQLVAFGSAYLLELSAPDPRYTGW